MNYEIWKFPLMRKTSQVVEMPVNAVILTLQFQMNTPYIWAMVDPDAEKEYRTFLIFGTGEPITKCDGYDYTYIGTFLSSGVYVWHVFEHIKLQ